MPFRFSLHTVLRLRQIAEQREERAIEEILRKIAQQRQHLSDLAKLKERLIGQYEIMRRVKTAAAEMALLQWEIQALTNKQITQEEQLAQLEEQRQAQMKVYEVAHRERELLSRMQEQQVGEFKRVQMRKEQMQMDDIFSSRRTPA